MWRLFWQRNPKWLRLISNKDRTWTILLANSLISKLQSPHSSSMQLPPSNSLILVSRHQWLKQWSHLHSSISISRRVIISMHFSLHSSHSSSISPSFNRTSQTCRRTRILSKTNNYLHFKRLNLSSRFRYSHSSSLRLFKLIPSLSFRCLNQSCKSNNNSRRMHNKIFNREFLSRPTSQFKALKASWSLLHNPSSSSFNHHNLSHS